MTDFATLVVRPCEVCHEPVQIVHCNKCYGCGRRLGYSMMLSMGGLADKCCGILYEKYEGPTSMVRHGPNEDKICEKYTPPSTSIFRHDGLTFEEWCAKRY